jgi:hypothetical protein
MTNPTKYAAERTLREIFRTMDGDRAQTIREAYYKAVEGLSVLADSLEVADLELGGPHDYSLIHEHLIACQAMTAMQASVLGRIL